MAQIYLSSTFSDLKEYRDIVYRTLRQMRHDVVAMEDYVATDQRPLAKCLADVSHCDIYLLILAWRYGYVPNQDNPDNQSITEMEFRHAVQKGKPCLVFLLAEDYPWSPVKMEKGEGAEKLQALRGELCERYTVSFFRSEDELGRLVGAAVSQCNPAAAAHATPAGGARVEVSAGREPHLGPLVSKMCDRSRQTTEFMDFFLGNLKAHRGVPQFFFVHGEEREGHDSFVERLTYTQIKGYAEKRWGEQKGVVAFKKVGWSYDGSPAELRQELKRLLFAEFDPVYMSDDLSATALSQLAARARTPLVVIQHRLYAARWNRAARELLEWYLTYWTDMKSSPARPQFLIFLSVIYPQSQPQNWWRRWKTAGAPDKERIVAELQQISGSGNVGCPCLLLRELLPLRPEEVKDWFSAHSIDSEKMQYEWLARIFKTGDGRAADFKSMADVEDELQSLVDALRQTTISARGRL
ncbi:MAG TPA: DUF4062 domain-containing protein [Blastocatellia bacterium]|nr:DUF4062 domain-containing protein [Blastocatellia bacterium]